MQKLKIAAVLGMTALLGGCVTPPSPSTNGFIEGTWFMLNQPYRYRIGSSNAVLTIPRGFVFDYASVPPPLTLIYPSQGRYSRAALIHDYLYATGVCTRLQSDNIFLIAMRESGVPKEARIEIYTGVRLGGEDAWDRNAADRQARRPRIIPPRFAYLTEGTWPQARATLIANGVRDQPPQISAAFCAKGNIMEAPQS